MRIDRKSILLIALIAGTTIGAQCISVNDDSVIVVNIEDITGNFAITPGAQPFASPNDCVTKDVSDYLSSDYGVVGAGRLVDIQYKANGVFGGSINNGTVTINQIPILAYSGPWATFAAETQSLLNPSSTATIIRNPLGVAELLDAVQDGRNITLCVGGSFSEPAPSGLSVDVTVFAQVDVDPG